MEDTAHAPPPAQVADPLEQMKEWINFGIAEGGQLNIANRDRRAERHIRDVCDRNYREALERSARRVKPWWRRIL